MDYVTVTIPSPGAAESVPTTTDYQIMLASEIEEHGRLDAEIYLSPGFEIRHALQHSGLPLQELGTLSQVWQPNRAAGIEVGYEQGTPYLAASQVFDIWPTPRKWLSDKTQGLMDSHATRGSMFISCSGTVGNVTIAYSPHDGKAVSSDLIRAEFEDTGMRNYVYTFLRTRFGRAMMQANQYGTIVKHLLPFHLKELPVPLLDDLLPAIDDRINTAYGKRDIAYDMDTRARGRFSEALTGVPEPPPPEETFTLPLSRVISGRRRLEAYHYNNRAEYVMSVYQNAPSLTHLGDIARVESRGRFKRIFGQADHTPYLDSDDIFKINPRVEKFLSPATRIDFSGYMVRAGCILMACSGQIYGINGQTALATPWHEEKVITQHILRIIPLPLIRSGYLQAVLSHPTLGRPLVISRAHGTSVPELAPADIESLPIPRLNPEIEAEIADAVEQAAILRMEADQHENDAIARLERDLEERLSANMGRRTRTGSPPSASRRARRAPRSGR